tara:strand:+ start:201 stop:821 length:621 start_codon:yes stop_codon:yes gene_type:complete
MSIVKLNNNGVKNATAFGSITGLGDLALIKTITASSSASVSLVDGTSSVVLDNTYKEYILTFNNIHPASNNVKLECNFSADTGSNYNVTKTSSAFVSYHNEAGNDYGFPYYESHDLAQATGYQSVNHNVGNENDECCSGYLHLFEPSSTTFVKHFIIQSNAYQGTNFSLTQNIAGYCNTTSAIDAIQFKMSSGNMDAGSFSLYGVN